MRDDVSDDLNEKAKALKEAVLKRDVDEALYLLKKAGSARKAKELASLAEQAPGPLLTIYLFRYSVHADGNKQTITVYRTSNYESAPVAGVTFED